MDESLQKYKFIRIIYDSLVTIIAWLYYLLVGLFFLPVFFYVYLTSRNVEIGMQRLNKIYFSAFFDFLKKIIPGLKFDIDKDIRTIRSSMIVCNHVSYLDPILLVSLFEKQKTIVKPVFFKVPFFGWLVKKSGYIPASSDGSFQSIMMKQVQGLDQYISNGGNVFIFPEGTRSRDGQIGKFKKGAFSIAKYCRAPIEILYITNTNTLFKPGKFLVNTGMKNAIKVERLARIEPDYENCSFSIKELMKNIHAIYKSKIDGEK